MYIYMCIFIYAYIHVCVSFAVRAVPPKSILKPGKPAAQNYGLRSVNSGLLWGRVAYSFELFCLPGGGTFQ